MKPSEKNFLLELLAEPSPSGWEARGQAIWSAHVRQSADAVDADAYGNTWAERAGSAADGPRVMLGAHADEIGFIVRHIAADGFLTLGPIGGSDRTLAAARRIRIFGDRGEVSGIVGNTAIHLRKTDKDKIPEWEDLYVDVGAASDREVAEMGLRVGHPAIHDAGHEVLPSGRLIGRALDNRISGFVIARILDELSRPRPVATTIAVNAVQEEIGSNGARMVAHRIRPDVAIIFDVTHATDTPGIERKKHGAVKLGGGPTVAHGGANHPLVVQRLIDVARKEKIPLQHEAVSRSTCTDADVVFISRSGIPTALVSIPLRYMHSPTEIVDLADVNAAIRLTAGFIRSLAKGESFGVTTRGRPTSRSSAAARRAPSRGQ